MTTTIDTSKIELRVNYGERINNTSIKLIQSTVNESPVLKLDNGLTLAIISMSVLDKETAEKIVSMFPKYCKLHISKLMASEFKYSISFPLGHDIINDNVAGAFNETAIKRVNKQIEILKTIFN